MYQYCLALFFLFHISSIDAHALQIGDRYGPMSEILCNQGSDWDIFTCEIIENYKYENSIQHIAIVEERFRGSMPDTIQLAVTYVGCTTMGRPRLTKMIPGSRHLIFGVKQKNGQYLTRYGDRWHSGILNVKINENYKLIEERSKKYLKVIREFRAMQTAKYTGSVSFSVEDYFSAEGQFLNGQPQGKWIHTDLQQDYKVIINYKNGRLHGKKYISSRHNDLYPDTYFETHENGVLVSSKSYIDNDPLRISREYSVVMSGAIKSSTYISYDSIGNKISEKNHFRRPHCFTQQAVLHGQFIDKSNYRYRQQPRSKGNYLYGAKVGQWSFYNEYGAEDSIVIYPTPKTTNSNFVYYYPNGKIAVEGNLIDDIPEGEWKEYDETGKLINQLTYENGLFYGVYIRNGRESHYANSKRNGPSNCYHSNGNIYKIQHYKEDVLEGLDMEYFPSGQLRRSCNYKNGKLTGKTLEYNLKEELINEINYDKKGAKTGYHKIHNSQGKITQEGAYLNGYKSGLWINYEQTDSVSKELYSTDLNTLMNGHNIAENRPKIKVVKYDPELHSK